MSQRAEYLTWERSRAGGSDLLMLVKIADVADKDGRNAWPEVPYLMKMCRMKERRTQYTLRRLVAAGEIDIEMNDDGREITLSGGRKFRPKWFIHVRCVCEYESYQAGWKPAKAAGFRTGRPKRKPAKVAHFDVHETRKNRRRNPHGRAAKPAKSSSTYKERSVSDPLVEYKQGSATPDEQAAAPPSNTPNENLNVITKVAHTLLDTLGLPDDGELANYTYDLKQRCAELDIAYDGDVVRKALDSAIWQRTHRRLA